MPVMVCNEAAWLLPLSSRALARALTAMLRAACDPQAAGEQSVELHVVRDGRMALENARCMGCQGPTNVLSFPGLAGGDASAPAITPACDEAAFPGVMLLSVDALHRECLLYGQEPAEHLLRLLAHGMGHLQGLDHGPDMDRLCQRMLEAGKAAVA